MLLNRKLTGKYGLFIPPSFSHYYRLKSVKEGNDKGNWWGWEVTREEQLNDASLYTISNSFEESVNKGDVKVKYAAESSTSEQKVQFSLHWGGTPPL